MADRAHSAFHLMRSYIGRRWKKVTIGICFIVLTNLLHVLLPTFIGKAIDLFRTNFSMIDIYQLCAVILAVEFAKGIFRFVMRYLIIGASWQIENDLRTHLFQHLLHLPVTYYDRTRTGDIIARLTNDLTAVRMLFGPAVMYTINAIVLLPLAIVFMLRLDVELTLYSVIPFPFIAIMMYVLGKRIHRNFVKVQESYSDMSAHIQEDLNGINVVKSYVREMWELSGLRKLSRRYVKHNRRVIQLQSMMFPLLDGFASAGFLILLWIGGKKILSGETSLGTVIALIMYIGILIWPSIALGWVTALFQRGIASLRRIQEILDEIPESVEDYSGPMLSGKISVHGLSFSFYEHAEVLSDISFDVQPGMTVAIVGRTGAGKSTLLGILAGIYAIESGMVSFDGEDIYDIPLSRLRSSIAYTPQESFLFSVSIAENIQFGRENATDEYIRKAAADAVVADEIESFPKEYNTILGERGVTVSGGQRQRITIARSLISDAPIMFFDDCLSNVDASTEKTILENIHGTIRKKTAIIVTQRIAAVKDADLILYMSAGKIIEEGNHDTLMKLDGEYAALYNEQELINALEDTDLS